MIVRGCEIDSSYLTDLVLQFISLDFSVLLLLQNPGHFEDFSMHLLCVMFLCVLIVVLDILLSSSALLSYCQVQPKGSYFYDKTKLVFANQYKI